MDSLNVLSVFSINNGAIIAQLSSIDAASPYAPSIAPPTDRTTSVRALRGVPFVEWACKSRCMSITSCIGDIIANSGRAGRAGRAGRFPVHFFLCLCEQGLVKEEV